MKTPGGSHEVPASARGDDDEADDRERADPSLRAMRQVWLEMREQDPPSGGMAELLAAARAKAQAMQPRPTLWQRVLAGMRRPPALAFATVVVVIGSALVVARRVDRAPSVSISDSRGEAERMREVRRADEPAREEAVAERTRLPSADGKTVAEERKPPAPPTRQAGDPGNGERAAKAESAALGIRPPQVPSRNAPRAAPEPEGGAAPTRGAPAAGPDKAEHHAEVTATGALSAPQTTADAAAPVVAHGSTAAPTVERPAPPPRRAPAPAPRQVHEQISRDDDSAGSPRPAPAAPAATDAEATTADRADRKKDAATLRTLSRAQLLVLHRQCEAAAERGDCVEVRRLVGRITAGDRSYRGRIAKTSPVAKCLAESAD